MNTLEIPRTRQYDAGEIAVVAQNPEGSATTITTLTITTHSDYRTVLKQSNSFRGKAAVPDNANEGIQIDLRSTHRQSSLNQAQQPRPNQQVDITARVTPQRQSSTDITIDFKQQQQQTSTNQWQQQQQQVQQVQQQVQQASTNQWQQQQQAQQPRAVPQSPPVSTKPVSLMTFCSVVSDSAGFIDLK